MNTWFDALLVTLLAIVTALGVQRGVYGLIWGFSGVVIALLVNALLPSPELAALLAVLLGAGVAFGVARQYPQVLSAGWAQPAGGVGGFLLGLMLVSALALSFPIQGKGTGATYPAPEFKGELARAVRKSLVVSTLHNVWSSPSPLRRLLAPDLR